MLAKTFLNSLILKKALMTRQNTSLWTWANYPTSACKSYLSWKLSISWGIRMETSNFRTFATKRKQIPTQLLILHSSPKFSIKMVNIRFKKESKSFMEIAFLHLIPWSNCFRQVEETMLKVSYTSFVTFIKVFFQSLSSLTKTLTISTWANFCTKFWPTEKHMHQSAVKKLKICFLNSSIQHFNTLCNSNMKKSQTTIWSNYG